MSYLPMPYRETPHYKALMAAPMFEAYNICYKANSINDKYHLNSFYMYIVRLCWVYWEVPDIHHLLQPPHINLQRNVARGSAKNDFIQIWDEYASHYVFRRDPIRYDVHYHA